MKIKKRREHGYHTTVEAIIYLKEMTENVCTCNKGYKRKPSKRFLPGFSLFCKENFLCELQCKDNKHREGKREEYPKIQSIGRKKIKHQLASRAQAKQHGKITHFIFGVAASFRDTKGEDGHCQPADHSQPKYRWKEDQSKVIDKHSCCRD